MEMHRRKSGFSWRKWWFYCIRLCL